MRKALWMAVEEGVHARSRELFAKLFAQEQFKQTPNQRIRASWACSMEIVFWEHETLSSLVMCLSFKISDGKEPPYQFSFKTGSQAFCQAENIGGLFVMKLYPNTDWHFGTQFPLVSCCDLEKIMLASRKDTISAKQVDLKERPQQQAEEAATHTEHQRPCTSQGGTSPAVQFTNELDIDLE
ncbi:hypothetical protein llap_5205 [Limosa lapponica baueri]|uniref:Uncharacterized protein n=1 Tax=Limosa lapponica baueri TaxID=1758121 RepID=A0A2I0UEK5_LIMLA|nr:hypothetical protein llap_5205 [Limosa lapponica baueri]